MSSTAWFVGDGTLLIQAAAAWRAQGHSVAGVASRDARVVAWAAEQQLELVEPASLGKSMEQKPCDYLFSVVNLSMLAPEVLARPKVMAINFHDGPLPERAGVNVPVWAIWEGATQHGVTWHEMVAEADAGRVLMQQRFDVLPDDTAFSLNARCFTAGIETFTALVEQITSGTLSPTPQDLSRRKYHDFYDRPPDGMALCFDVDAEELARHVRALDFGGYPNPVGVPRLFLASGAVLTVGAAEAVEGKGAPGEVLAIDDAGVRVATRSGAVHLSKVKTLSGAPAALEPQDVRVGTILPALDAAQRARLSEVVARAAKSEGAWLRLLRAPNPLAFPWPTGSGSSPVASVEVSLPAKSAADTLLAFWARLSGSETFDVGYASPALERHALLMSEVPLRVEVAKLEQARAVAESRCPPLVDLFQRQRELPAAPLLAGLWCVDAFRDEVPAGRFIAQVRSDGRVRFSADGSVADRRRLELVAARLETFASKVSASTSLFSVALSSEEELRTLAKWNATERPVPDTTLTAQFVARVAQHPDKAAVVSGGRTLSYRELDARSNAVAKKLRELGVGPDGLVGLYLARSVDMVVGALGILKAGGAYVPLDPAYPADRLKYMVEDARIAVVVTDRAHAVQVPGGQARQLVVDDGSFETGLPTLDPAPTGPQHLAYVIYTSGSTGRPKGVMIEHQNVINFFVAMDDVLGSDPGTWLAVTSMSFDISVLELFWTLTRGFTVVVHAGDAQAPRPRRMDFSLFYFASDEGGAVGREKYKLLLEGAKFGDQHGFAAVWTPERHFHAFGGLYPNPSVTSAALAMVTERIHLRGGSCVAPLHSPIRIAEEWALVDNLSNGRVGVAFASGWHANDFAIRPDAFARRKDEMMDALETVRRLWRGEKVPFKSGVGKDVPTSVLPRPVQRELPMWLTAAGNPETFEAAGRVGAGVLTHLLGQTFEEVADKVRIYRAAWERAGHKGRGNVTLMLHTFVGEDDATVKETVRKPMKGYLTSAVGLVKEAAWSFPTFKQQTTSADGGFSTDSLSPAELDALLDFAFERYYARSGLFGSVATAVKTVEQVRAIDVDEVGCLIDFGVPTEKALAHLPYLARVLEQTNAGAAAHGASAAPVAAPQSLAQLFTTHRPTHFQCTPSMASMLVLDDEAKRGLGGLSTMLVGGEALPVALAQELRSLVKGSLFNVYGPTETTVWSTSHRLDAPIGSVSIGKPLANTDVLILDAHGQVCPPGDEGELCIGGKGVVRGYFDQPELTAKRFVVHPLRSGERLYRTGDLAAWGSDGLLHFKGRLDFQVKIRGHRLELGEIEAALGEHPGVRECAVTVREDTPGDKRLVAYFIPASPSLAPADLKAHLAGKLPEVMVPQAWVAMKAFPRTPNRKLDRKALPAPEVTPAAGATPAAGKSAPSNVLEETIAQVWREVLALPAVGVDDNFFDLGGHSLLTIQTLNRLKGKVSSPLTLVDLFRHTTIRGLAAFLSKEQPAAAHLDESAARGAARARLRRNLGSRGG